jgi:hypothetical protein
MQTHLNFLFYIAQFFFEGEMFQKKVVEEIKTHVVLNNFFSNEKCGKIFTAGQATDVALAHCILDS